MNRNPDFETLDRGMRRAEPLGAYLDGTRDIGLVVQKRW